MRWPLQPLQPLQKTQLQPPFCPSVDSLCHPWFTTTNLSYSFPIFETSATACRLVRYYWYMYIIYIYNVHILYIASIWYGTTGWNSNQALSHQAPIASALELWFQCKRASQHKEDPCFIHQLENSASHIINLHNKLIILQVTTVPSSSSLVTARPKVGGGPRQHCKSFAFLTFWSLVCAFSWLFLCLPPLYFPSTLAFHSHSMPGCLRTKRSFTSFTYSS